VARGYYRRSTDDLVQSPISRKIDMKRWILILGLLVAAAVGAVFLLGRGGEEGTPEDGSGTGERPPIRVEITWPDDLDAAARETLEPLVRGIEGDEDSVRRSLVALRAPDLLESLKDRAASIILLLRPILEELLPAAEDPIRREAIAVLAAWLPRTEGESREAASLAVPLGSLETVLAASSSELLRREIVALLPEIRVPRAFQLIARALPDPEPSVRRAAARALAASGERRAVEPLRRRLGTEADGGVRAEILRAFLREPTLRGADLAARVRPFAEDEDPRARAAALELLGVLGDRTSLKAIVAALGSEDRDTRLAAIVALGRLGGPEAADALARVEDPGEEDTELAERLKWARERCRE
jgi:HEAT repeat protein